jgi:hypothetical protein
METYNAKIYKNEVRFAPKYDNDEFLKEKLDQKIAKIKALLKEIFS